MNRKWGLGLKQKHVDFDTIYIYFIKHWSRKKKVCIAFSKLQVQASMLYILVLWSVQQWFFEDLWKAELVLVVIFCFLKINLHVDFEVAKCFGSEWLNERLQLRASRFYNYGAHKQSDLKSVLPATMQSLEKRVLFTHEGVQN